MRITSWGMCVAACSLAIQVPNSLAALTAGISGNGQLTVGSLTQSYPGFGPWNATLTDPQHPGIASISGSVSDTVINFTLHTGTNNSLFPFNPGSRAAALFSYSFQLLQQATYTLSGNVSMNASGSAGGYLIWGFAGVAGETVPVPTHFSHPISMTGILNPGQYGFSGQIEVTPAGDGVVTVDLTGMTVQLAPVPEPAGLGLTAIGGMMLLRRRRRHTPSP